MCIRDRVYIENYINELKIDVYKRQAVFKNNQLIKLTSTEYKLLSLLAKFEGRVLTHTNLLKEIWGVGHQLETQYLRVFIGTLRKKIEDDPNHPLHICLLYTSRCV